MSLWGRSQALTLDKAANSYLTFEWGYFPERHLVLTKGWAYEGQASQEVAETFLFWGLISGRRMAEMAGSSSCSGD